MRRRHHLATFLLDGLTLAVALLVASLVVLHTPIPWHAPNAQSAENLVATLFASFAIVSYLSYRATASSVPAPSYGRATTIAFGTFLTTSAVVLFGRWYYSRPLIIWTLGTWVILQLAVRMVQRALYPAEQVMVISAEKELVDELTETGSVVVTQVVLPSADAPSIADVPADGLAVDFRTVLSEDIARFVSSCSVAGVPLQSFTDLYEEHTGRLPIVHLSEGWEIEMPLSQKTGYLRMKRFIDLGIVIVTLPVWLPVLVIVAGCAVVAQGRPVLLHQPRVGLNQRRFNLHKFRTMVRDAEEDGPRFTTLVDPRVTPLGRFLRRFRLDEVPQVWNVLRGDMSLVGPRPERPEFVEAFTQEIPFYRYRHHVRPGCAGWAQVRYGYADEDDTVEKLKYDLYYVKSASAWLDLETLVRSIGVVVSGRGVR